MWISINNCHESLTFKESRLPSASQHVCLSLCILMQIWIQTLIKNLKHSPLFKKQSRGLCSLGGSVRSLSAFLFTKRLNMLHFPQIYGLMCLTVFCQFFQKKNRLNNKRNKCFITCKKHFCCVSSDSKQPETWWARGEVSYSWRVLAPCVGSTKPFTTEHPSCYRALQARAHTHSKNNSPSIMSCQQHTFT